MEGFRIMIVDDHPVVREGLRALLSKSTEMRIVAEAGDGLEALGKLKAVEVDLVLMDWQLPNMNGLEATQKIRESHPNVKVVMLTNRLDAEAVKSAIQNGASGYLLKDVSREDIEHAVRNAMDGRTVLHSEAQDQLAASLNPRKSPLDELTSRERDVLTLIAKGMSNKEIGNSLSLTEGTVKGYVSSILSKTGAADRTQAALLAVRSGLAEL
ncbi:MAG: response regulator transcription factor [Armatimonadetes bacterium]|nr:response regulator transcription factor [Armatimonadota bacterium]